LTLKNIILFLFFLVVSSVIYYFYLLNFQQEPTTQEKEPLHIEPIVFENSNENEEEEEVFSKLQDVLSNVIEEQKLSPEEEAIEVLVKLEEVLPPEMLSTQPVGSVVTMINEPKKITNESRVVELIDQLEKEFSSSKRVNVKIKDIKKKMVVSQKKSIPKRKVVHKRRKYVKKSLKKRISSRKKTERVVKKLTSKNRLSIEEKRELKRAQSKLEECRERRVKLVKKLNAKTTHKEITLGVVGDSYELPESERKSFNNLETLSISKPFVLEKIPEIKEPQYIGKELVDDKNLQFVKTLGVVSVSNPYVDGRGE